MSGRETVTTPLGLGPLSLGVAAARRIALLGVLVSLVEDGEDAYLGDDGVAVYRYRVARTALAVGAEPRAAFW